MKNELDKVKWDIVAQIESMDEEKLKKILDFLDGMQKEGVQERDGD